MNDVELAQEWQEVVSAENGKIWIDRHEDGIRFLILRGPVAVCAYVGVPESHPLAGHSYEALPLDCHGGLTYDGLGDGKTFPSGWYWYGWDYAHCGDFCTYDEKRGGDCGDKKWTPSLVDGDSWTARYEFRKLMNLAEAVRERSR